MTNLTYNELEHAQSKQHMHVAYLGVVNRSDQTKSTICGFHAMDLIKRFEVKIHQFFAIFDIVIVLASH